MKAAWNRLLDCVSESLAGSHDVDAEEVSGEFVRDAVDELFAGVDDYRITPMNSEYWVVDREDFRSILRRDLTNWTSYRSDRWDCVDYSAALRGRVGAQYGINSVGSIVSYGETAHKFNVVVYADGSAEIYEPQRGQWLGFSEAGRDLLFGDEAHSLEGARVWI